MTLLIIYIFIAIGVSFLCSILEAVLLSVNHAYVSLLQQDGKATGKIWNQLKGDIGKPLAAILTLNTIAHTLGAAGAGAQAVAVFGSHYVGIISAVLTLLILIFSEIIPKTLGAHYWKQLASLSAYTLKYMIIGLYPFVKLAEVLTSKLTSEDTLTSFSREEFSAMVELSKNQGQIEKQESQTLKNLLSLNAIRARDSMTPRTVLFSLPAELLVEEFFYKHDKVSFSRIPIYKGNPDKIDGYVIKSDLLMAQARGNGDKTLENYLHPISSVLETTPLNNILEEMIAKRAHMNLVVNEYGSVLGILTLEDIFETILGLEIVDEKDKNVDMQKEAKKIWRRKMKEQGLEFPENE